MKIGIIILFISISSILSSKEPLFLLSIPKSGSHLVDKILHLIKNDFEDRYDYTSYCHPGFYKDSIDHRHKSPDCPKELYSNPNQKKIIIIRDIRDCFCSSVFYLDILLNISHNKNMYMFRNMRNWNELSFAQKVEFLTKEKGTCWSWSNIIEDINFFSNTPNTLIIKFEDIIGPRGQGEKETMLNCLKGLLEFLEVKYSTDDLDHLSEKVFGRDYYDPGLHNFRKGQIGDYKNHLTQEAISKIEKKYINYLTKFNYTQTPNSKSQSAEN